MEVVRLSRELRNHFLLFSVILFFPMIEGVLSTIARSGHFEFRSEWITWPLVIGIPILWMAKQSAKTGRFMAGLIAVLGFVWCFWNYQRAAHAGDIILSLWAWLKFVLIGLWSFRAWNLWNASFLRSGKKWYEGLPQGIPNLLCQIKPGAKPAKVNRIDRQGLIIFGLPDVIGNLRKVELDLELSHQASAKKIICKAQIMSRQKDPLILGLKFKDLTADQQKDLGDFVEKLKGEGYEDLSIHA